MVSHQPFHDILMGGAVLGWHPGRAIAHVPPDASSARTPIAHVPAVDLQPRYLLLSRGCRYGSI